MELLTLHVTLLEQHLQLQARLQVSCSAVTHYRKFRNLLLEYCTTVNDQFSTCQAQLQETQAKYDKLAAQVSEEDPLLKELYDLFDGNYPTYRRDSIAVDLCKLRHYLWPDDADEPDTYCHLTLQGSGGGYYIKIQDPSSGSRGVIGSI